MIEVIDHTADVGLRIVAPNLGGLFAEAGRGLFALIMEDPRQVRPSTSWKIDLAGDSLEYLLFDWLTELLHFFEDRHVVLGRFDVMVDGNSLHAGVSGEPIDPARHRPLREIKAITYHCLSVGRRGDDWLAEVIVDI